MAYPILEESSVSRLEILKIKPSASQTDLTTIRKSKGANFGKMTKLGASPPWSFHSLGGFPHHLHHAGFPVFCLPTANQTPLPTLLLICCPFLPTLLHLGHKLIWRSYISVSLIPQTWPNEGITMVQIHTPRYATTFSIPHCCLQLLTRRASVTSQPPAQALAQSHPHVKSLAFGNGFNKLLRSP